MLYTISDIHLSEGVLKPMDVFGGKWQDYTKKIEKNFANLLKSDDILVIGGDISWGINLNESLLDFKFLEKFNCKKIILKGNHDLWWCTVNKMHNFLTENNISNIEFLHNNFYSYKDVAICGTRGWIFIENSNDELDEKVYKREVLRLENSLSQAKNAGFTEIYCFLHYPPLYGDIKSQEIFDLLKKYNVSKCIYGHLHGESFKNAKTGIIDGIEFILASADYLNFTPILLKK